MTVAINAEIENEAMSAINLRAEEQSCACQNIAVVIRFIIAGISDPDILVYSARWYFAQFFYLCVAQF